MLKVTAAVFLLATALAGSVAAGPYEDGTAAYGRRDYSAAMRLWRPLADEGDAAAQFMVGVMYKTGLGVPQDDATSVFWYRRAAEQGLSEAQFQVGLHHFQLALQHCRQLGFDHYSPGKACSQGESQAEKWLRKAADQGHAKAQYSLATLYRNGVGVAQSDAAAMSWYQKAAGQGLAEAQYGIGVMYEFGAGVPRDFATAVGWFRKAADQGDTDAQHDLAMFYYLGRGVPQDYVAAAKFFRMLADQSNAEAQAILSTMYFFGRGVPQDYVSAHMRMNLAAAAGNKDAAKFRETVATKMTPAQIAEAQKLAREWKPSAAR